MALVELNKLRMDCKFKQYIENLIDYEKNITCMVELTCHVCCLASGIHLEVCSYYVVFYAAVLRFVLTDMYAMMLYAGCRVSV